MIFVSALLLLCPGFLVWKLCGTQNLSNNSSVLRICSTILLDDILIFAAGYLFLRLISGNSSISFSPKIDPTADSTIYDIGFTWKYGVLSCGISTVLAGFKAIFYKLLQFLKSRAH